MNVTSSSRRRRREQGSAFVISILVLFVLSVLGMALMLTTTTEKDIAINYRWGEQAFFNADAALEYGKNLLASQALVNGDFRNILPPPRADVTVTDDTQPWGTAHPDPGACNPTTSGCRDYQYFIDQCPQGGGSGPCSRVYIGRVLPRTDSTLAMWDFRSPVGTQGDLDGDGTQDIDGTFTLWVRRPLVGTEDYGFSDDRHDRVILTAEGTAPNAYGAGTGRPVSLRRLEMSIRLPSQGVEGTGYDDASKRNDATAAGGDMGAVQSVAN